MEASYSKYELDSMDNWETRFQHRKQNTNGLEAVSYTSDGKHLLIGDKNAPLKVVFDELVNTEIINSIFKINSHS